MGGEGWWWSLIGRMGKPASAGDAGTGEKARREGGGVEGCR